MSSDNEQSSLSYKDAGVDIDAGNALVERIKSVSKSTKRPEVLGGLGGFGALCELPAKYRNPVLVSGTDGVGTKLKLAMELQQHGGVGIDLVAMCVNDLIVCGAEPLFFLDYYATGKLDVDVAAEVIEGIGKGCQQAGCALIGGETAEMPGMYQAGDYDLAGFCVGVVERDSIIDGSKVEAGDSIIGLKSAGPHSNGFSLIRKILERAPEAMQDKKLIAELMAPTRIYVKPLLTLLEEMDIHALAHITGGGITENLPRVLPDNCCADIDCSSWQQHACFDWLQQVGKVDNKEMLKTFNCGIGMILVVPATHTTKVMERLQALGEEALHIGEIRACDTGADRVQYRNL